MTSATSEVIAADMLDHRKREFRACLSLGLETAGLLDVEVESESDFESKLQKSIKASEKLSNAALKKRLARANELPERVPLLTTGFRRNPDVIVAVLRRAKGVCEQPAPFMPVRTLKFTTAAKAQ